MLPDPGDPPTERTKFTINALVADFVAGELGQPERSAGLGKGLYMGLIGAPEKFSRLCGREIASVSKAMNPTGYTCQHTAIAIALRIALVEYYDRADLISKKGSINGSEELESRRLTIVLLAAALCEACINLALALSMPAQEFQEIERKPTLRKWFEYSKRVNANFVLNRDDSLGVELAFLFSCRDSITHAKAEIFSDNGRLHPGNHEVWAILNHDRVITIAKLPGELLRMLCSSGAPLVDVIFTSVDWELRIKEFEARAFRQRVDGIPGETS